MNSATSPTGWARNPDGSPGYTWNPLSGCKNHTPEGLCLGGLFPCYAWKLAHGRLKPLYLRQQIFPVGVFDDEFYSAKPLEDPFYPRFWEDRLDDLPIATGILEIDGYKLHKGIFVCDMGDLFGVGVPEEWTAKVLDRIKRSSIFHRFYLLTKQPQNLIKFSPFPENCWVGVTATKFEAVIEATKWLNGVKASVKYLSLEPLLDWDLHEKALTKRLLEWGEVSWLIIGACTGSHRDIEALSAKYPDLWGPQIKGNKWVLFPKIEWVREIVEAADKAGIKVFLKDNLAPLIRWPQDGPWAFKPASNMLRQELPK